MVVPALAAGMLIKKAAGSTPLSVYGSNLKWWYDAATNVSGAGTGSGKWEDRVGSVDLDEDVTDNDFFTLVDPYANLNNHAALQFRPTDTNDRGRRAQSSASFFDNMWGGAGNKNIAFAAYREVHPQFGLNNNTLISKGFFNNGVSGWTIEINSSGSFFFRANNSAGTTWFLTVSNYYATRQKVLGHITFNGSFVSNPNITIRLWSGTSWQTVSFSCSGNISVNDANANFCIGNNSDETFDQPFNGGIATAWFTNPAITTINEAYLSQFI